MDGYKREISVPYNLSTEDLSVIRAIQGTNPKFCTPALEYTENCQRCVTAYEARRRGYDVTASPYLVGQNDLLPYMTNPLGWPAAYKNHRLESCAASTGEQARQRVESLMKLYGNHGRAIIKVDWLMRNKGHLFMAENRDDMVFFIDPQTGSLDVAWYFSYVNPHTVVIMRTDQTEFTKLAEQCFERST